MPVGRLRHGVGAKNVDATLSLLVESRLLPKEEGQFYHLATKSRDAGRFELNRKVQSVRVER